MLTRIDNILTGEELAEIIAVCAQDLWVDGDTTASGGAAAAKHNRQLPREHKKTLELNKLIVRALNRSREFVTTVMPKRVFSPLISAYEPGMAYGPHVDSALMQSGGTLRTDVAMTLFVSSPETYDGGELVLNTSSGEMAVKLPAGSAVCYPPHFVHEVRAVSRGQRLAAVSWIESLVRSAEQRAILKQLNDSIEMLRARPECADECREVNNAYQQLMRMWVAP